MGAIMDDFKRGLFAGLGVDHNDPCTWVKEHDVHPWSKQVEILNSVRDNRYTAVHSAHGMGKSFIAAQIIAWWIDTHPVGETFVVSTAPTAAQVSAIMWREVTKVHSKNNLRGKINRAGYPQWFIDGELVGYGRKPADYEQSAFQGIHAKYVLVVIDEAGGVAKHLYEAIDALATNQFARVLAIGNPDDPASHHATICKPGSGWNTIHLDALRSPNMTYDRIVGPDPSNPLYPLTWALMRAEGIPFNTEDVPDELRFLWTDERWIEERIERWCGVSSGLVDILSPQELEATVIRATTGSPIFTAKVRGMFPTAASEGVIPLGWVQRAIERWHDLVDNHSVEEYSLVAHQSGSFVLGVDVARSGDDQTVFCHRYGSFVTKLEKYRISDTTEIADRAAAYLHEPGSIAVVDVIGVGSGVFDLLRRYRTNHKIIGEAIPWNASAQSHRQDKLGQFKFLNDRAAAWWSLREALDPAFGSNVALPDDDEMVAELVAVKFGFNAGGTLKIESKDDIKRRIGRSTDCADAVVAAWWAHGATTAEFMPYASNEQDVAWRGRASRGAVYNYEGYEPITEADMFAGPGQGNLSSYRQPGPGGGRYSADDDWGF